MTPNLPLLFLDREIEMIDTFRADLREELERMRGFRGLFLVDIARDLLPTLFGLTVMSTGTLAGAFLDDDSAHYKYTLLFSLPGTYLFSRPVSNLYDNICGLVRTQYEMWDIKDELTQ
jgi:hypothetical protein